MAGHAFGGGAGVEDVCRRWALVCFDFFGLDDRLIGLAKGVHAAIIACSSSITVHDRSNEKGPPHTRSNHAEREEIQTWAPER